MFGSAQSQRQMSNIRPAVLARIDRASLADQPVRGLVSITLPVQVSRGFLKPPDRLKAIQYSDEVLPPCCVELGPAYEARGLIVAVRGLDTGEIEQVIERTFECAAAGRGRARASEANSRCSSEPPLWSHPLRPSTGQGLPGAGGGAGKGLRDPSCPPPSMANGRRTKGMPACRHDGHRLLLRLNSIPSSPNKRKGS